MLVIKWTWWKNMRGTLTKHESKWFCYQDNYSITLLHNKSGRLLHMGTRSIMFYSIVLVHRTRCAACTLLWFELVHFLAGIRSCTVDLLDTFRAPSNTRDHIDHLYIWNNRELQESVLVSVRKIQTISSISGLVKKWKVCKNVVEVKITSHKW